MTNIEVFSWNIGYVALTNWQHKSRLCTNPKILKHARLYLEVLRGKTEFFFLTRIYRIKDSEVLRVL